MNVGNIHITDKFTLGNLFIITWFSVSLVTFIFLFIQHQKLLYITSIIKETDNTEYKQILEKLCSAYKIKNKPRIIQLKIKTSPFIIGGCNPTIVLPNLPLSEEDIKYIFMHELAHINNYHTIIKKITNIILVIYWWNPFILFLSKKLMQALEVQADSQVIKNLSNHDSLSYLELLLKLSKALSKQQHRIIFSTFSFGENAISYRIQLALKYNFFNERKHIKLSTFFPALLLPIMLTFFSFMFTFEPYKINQSEVTGTFEINAKTSYFVKQDENSYDLYVNNIYRISMQNIPTELNQLPLYETNNSK